MAAASTSHKIQGQTVHKPKSLVVDIQDTKEAGMVYVMLSRVCSIEQIFILDKLNPEKIKACPAVKKEVMRMNAVSVNSNPPRWKRPGVLGTRVSSLNVRSLRKHMEDVVADPVLLYSDVMCLQETWLERGEGEQARYQLEGFDTVFNSQGRGKGLATYVRQGKFRHAEDVSTPHLQMTKVTSEKLDVISVYRSQEAPFNSTIDHLHGLVDLERTTLIVGDLNYCHLKAKNDLSTYLKALNFEQLVPTATHLEGNLLDQAHLRRVGEVEEPEVATVAEYYTDHDLVTVLLPKPLSHLYPR